jgi:hypothetical protein
MAEIPNLRWYSGVSEKRGVVIRCPFATVEACPRYYQSLSLLGEAGSTKITKAEDDRLLEKWKKSDLWPRTAELETSVLYADGEPRMFSNFCPEVTFDRFGFFATYLARYSDEVDVGMAHEKLGKEKAPAGDPRWSWASAQVQHYTECPIYAVLARRAETIGISPPQIAEPWWRKHLAELITAVLVTIVTILISKTLS